ncbi:hypothetical protein FACS189494_10810 [Spirochaetia bacterium]|nr:hypothetical protein FACS189494_10810 [Spirochaetia bacterium]
MSLALNLQVDKHYTYADCLDWPEDYRAEIIDGEICEMPTPSRKHQGISMELEGILWTFLKSHPIGKIYHAPFGVRLNPKSDYSDDVVLEPDIAVVCDLSKLDDRSCNGAPDMVVEILSPSTASKDMVLKFRKYAEAGVREYWIINPDQKTIQVCTLEKDGDSAGRYVVSAFDENESVPVNILPGLEINLRDIFAD